jgi:hypothetical protein
MEAYKALGPCFTLLSPTKEYFNNYKKQIFTFYNLQPTIIYDLNVNTLHLFLRLIQDSRIAEVGECRMKT